VEGIMEKVLAVASLLGEDNVNRLKETITNLLIERCQDELDDMAIYMVDYEQLFDEVHNEVKSIMKDKIMKMYLEKAEGKLSEIFESMV
jgi:hypothetical protein